METDIKNDRNMSICFTVLNLNTVTNTFRYEQAGSNYYKGGYTVGRHSLQKKDKTDHRKTTFFYFTKKKNE